MDTEFLQHGIDYGIIGLSGLYELCFPLVLDRAAALYAFALH